ncbi:GntR family transcriptional regulator [Streptomyces sp. NPDC060006]|uniref:GntR family transcriptional regulator n=1 Tax=unclassified Streptomyces TaxID=2593676 RepID=UPI0036CEF272
MLAGTLRASIKDGRWKGGEIRTQADLIHQHGTQQHIVAMAIRLLQEEGLVETRQRIGTRPKVEGESWTTPDGVPQAVHIARTIRARITAGTYPVSEPLPALADLAAEFNVSVSVVSEALQPLKSDGVLTYIPFHGLVVTASQPHSPVASHPIA